MSIEHSENVFSVIESIVKKKLYAAEAKQEVQRQDIAIDRDAARIAGSLTDELYRRVHECV